VNGYTCILIYMYIHAIHMYTFKMVYVWERNRSIHCALSTWRSRRYRCSLYATDRSEPRRT